MGRKRKLNPLDVMSEHQRQVVGELWPTMGYDAKLKVLGVGERTTIAPYGLTFRYTTLQLGGLVKAIAINNGNRSIHMILCDYDQLYFDTNCINRWVKMEKWLFE